MSTNWSEMQISVAEYAAPCAFAMSQGKFLPDGAVPVGTSKHVGVILMYYACFVALLCHAV